jgi:hypothetical protein
MILRSQIARTSTVVLPFTLVLTLDWKIDTSDGFYDGWNALVRRDSSYRDRYTIRLPPSHLHQHHACPACPLSIYPPRPAKSEVSLRKWPSESKCCHAKGPMCPRESSFLTSTILVVARPRSHFILPIRNSIRQRVIELGIGKKRLYACVYISCSLPCGQASSPEPRLQLRVHRQTSPPAIAERPAEILSGGEEARRRGGTDSSRKERINKRGVGDAIQGSDITFFLKSKS